MVLSVGLNSTTTMASLTVSQTRRLSPVLLITHKACSEHLIKGHPEQPKRVGSIVNALISSFNADEMAVEDNSPRATVEQLLRFHTERHVTKLMKAFEKVENSKKNIESRLDGDTSVMRGTGEACFRAAGGAVHAVDVLLGPNPSAKSCFVAVRPPGHHAEPDHPMGFCFFGNAGIAALHAREVYGVQRIAILDW
jgi:acetoin utilization deacetylase AcuC-like enzyme